MTSTEEDAFKAILALLKKLEFSGNGKQYDGGEYEEICPICKEHCSQANNWKRHNGKCEMKNAINEIERAINQDYSQL